MPSSSSTTDRQSKMSSVCEAARWDAKKKEPPRGARQRSAHVQGLKRANEQRAEHQVAFFQPILVDASSECRVHTLDAICVAFQECIPKDEAGQTWENTDSDLAPINGCGEISLLSVSRILCRFLDTIASITLSSCTVLCGHGFDLPSFIPFCRS